MPVAPKRRIFMGGGQWISVAEEEMRMLDG